MTLPRRQLRSRAPLRWRRIARAQTYPARPVRIIVPVAAGGPNDIVARLIAQQLTERFNTRFYVDNIPPGSSILGTEVLAKATPDGATIGIVPNNVLINPGLSFPHP